MILKKKEQRFSFTNFGYQNIPKKKNNNKLTHLTDIWGLFTGLLREHVSVGSTIKVQSGQSQAHYRAGPAS